MPSMCGHTFVPPEEGGALHFARHTKTSVPHPSQTSLQPPHVTFHICKLLFSPLVFQSKGAPPPYVTGLKANTKAALETPRESGDAISIARR